MTDSAPVPSSTPVPSGAMDAATVQSARFGDVDRMLAEAIDGVGKADHRG